MTSGAIAALLWCLVLSGMPTSLRMGPAILWNQEAAIDTKTISGTWRIDKLSLRDSPAANSKDLHSKLLKQTLRITPNGTVTVAFAEVRILEWAAKYDFHKAPVWLDLTSKFPPPEKAAKQPAMGLLRLDGETLTICVGFDSRPTDFAQNGKATSMLIVATRVKKGH